MSPDDADEIEVKFVMQSNREYYPRPETRRCGPLDGSDEDYAAQRLGAGESRAWYCRMPVDSCIATSDALFIDPAPLYTIKVGVDETDNMEMSEMVKSGLKPVDWYAGDCRDYQVQMYVPYDRTLEPTVCHIVEGGYRLEDTKSKSCLDIETPYYDTYLLVFDVRTA